MLLKKEPSQPLKVENKCVVVAECHLDSRLTTFADIEFHFGQVFVEVHHLFLSQLSSKNVIVLF